MNAGNLSRDDMLFGGVGLLLVIDLLAFAWFTFSFGPIHVSSTASGDPDGWLGVLAVLTTIAAVADLAVERFSPQTTLPSIGGSRAMTRLVLTAASAALIALKFVLHIHFHYFGFGFYAAVVLLVGMVYLAVQANQRSSALV